MTAPVQPTAGDKAARDVAALLRARNSLIWIVSREEERVERLILNACEAAKYAPLFWDAASGLSTFDGKPARQGASLTDPAAILAAVRESEDREVYVLRDFPAFLRDPYVLRGLRTLARTLKDQIVSKARAIVVLSPSAEIPPELSGSAVVVEWPLPDRQEIATLLDSVIALLPDGVRENAAPNGTRDAAIDAAVGLSEIEARACYNKSIVTSKRIDPRLVANEKRRIVAASKTLEWIDPLAAGLDGVGGLEGLKSWLVARRSAFSPAAREYGLPAPKGLLLVGPPGTGKSLTAKAVATAWGMPLLKLDLGAMKSKFVGESEGNLRRALRLAETVSPCVVWLDEVEKALQGATSGASDGGVSSDALGAILSWMQDRQGSVFVVATANDVTSLPPELLRKGRFDDIFFVDLPTDAERRGVVAAALRANGRDEQIDTAAVAKVTPDFTGAEIAALVPEALYAAFADGARALTTQDLVNAAQATVPLAKTAAEKINKVREWAKGRARPASAAPRSDATGKGGLDL